MKMSYCMNMVYNPNVRPICINYGCNTPAANAGSNKSGGKRYRSFCAACHDAEYGRRPYKPGVKPFKKKICSNKDSRLGFPCATDFSKIPTWAKGITDIDHIDGDRNNWSKENLQELCCTCHRIKGVMRGDHKGNPRSHLPPPTAPFFNKFFNEEVSLAF